MTTDEAVDVIAEKLKDFSNELNEIFSKTDNLYDPIDLVEYELIDDIFQSLKFKDEEMV